MYALHSPAPPTRTDYELPKTTINYQTSNSFQPYGFYFTTTGPDPENPRRDAVIARSPFHFIGGKILSLQEVKNLCGESSILHQNMVNNGCEAVVLSNNPSWCRPFRPDDVIVQPPASPRRGSATDPGINTARLR